MTALTTRVLSCPEVDIVIGSEDGILAGTDRAAVHIEIAVLAAACRHQRHVTAGLDVRAFGESVRGCLAARTALAASRPLCSRTLA